MAMPPVSRQPQAPRTRLWIKICGMTTAAGVDAAIASGVDAVGFVFYPPSSRWIPPRDAAALAARVPGSVKKVAVFLHPEQKALDEVMASFRPDIVQLDLEDLAGLTVPAGIGILPVLRSGQLLPAMLPPRVLFEGPVSGVGATADWSTALSLVERCQMILAGGLDPGNVATAIRVVRPYGVDVSSGVEQSPGIKDPARIAEFVRAARLADCGPGAEQ